MRLDEELALIRRHRLSGFFLLHHEVLEIAREVALEVRGRDSPRMLLPPGRGRGSSVGSIVCYLTGLSHVDPVDSGLSLGRFLNQELASVPDIDLDFPRDIRAGLILRVHERYGDRHAALVGALATYRARGAIRELGKVLGLPAADIARLATASDGWHAADVEGEIAQLPGLAERAGDRRFRALAALAREIAGLPRHLSQHPGGMVISDRPLSTMVPLQPAAMEGRTICQWDKDSCGDAGFLKIDLLGLGMLSAVEECVVSLAEEGATVDLSRIPLDDPGVYARDPGGRHRRRVPDRVAGADADAPADAAEGPRRPRGRGGAGATRADPGRRRAPVHPAARGAAARPRLPDPLRPPAARRAARRDARRDRVPGPGAGGGGGARGLLPRPGGGPAPRDEPAPLARRRCARSGTPSARARRRRTCPSTWRRWCSRRSSRSPRSGSRRRTRRRSRCLPTRARGCGATTPPSSCARC